MARGAIDLLPGGYTNATPADSSPVIWVGGRSCFVVDGGTLPTTVQLMMVGPNGGSCPIPNTVSSQNQCTPCDLPAGQYFVHMSGGSASAVFARIVSVSYNE